MNGKPSAADRLDALVRFPTDQPRADERPLARYLARLLADGGADEVVLTDVPRREASQAGGHGAWVLARWGTPKVLLNAHLDTVPPNGLADGAWRGPPTELRRDGDRLIGLGACDTKGAIAAILAALDHARPRDLAVLFSGDEEHGGSCVRDFLASPHARGLERAVVFEPTSCRVGTRHRGVLSISARFVGQGGHSSRADLLPSPIAVLARLAGEWDAWGRARRDEGPEGFRGMCLNLARLDGGVAFNVIPDEATLLASVRPPPGADLHALKGALAGPALRLGCQVEFPVEHHPFATGDLAGFAGLLPAAALSAPVDLAYWTEAAVLSEAGIDAVVYGPGDIAQAHAPEEWVRIADLERATADITALILETARR